MGRNCILRHFHYPRNVSRDFRRLLCGGCCSDVVFPSDALADCEPLVGAILRFRCFRYLLTPLDTKQHIAQIRASPSKHTTNAVKNN